MQVVHARAFFNVVALCFLYDNNVYSVSLDKMEAGVAISTWKTKKGNISICDWKQESWSLTTLACVLVIATYFQTKNECQGLMTSL